MGIEGRSWDNVLIFDLSGFVDACFLVLFAFLCVRFHNKNFKKEIVQQETFYLLRKLLSIENVLKCGKM